MDATDAKRRAAAAELRRRIAGEVCFDAGSRALYAYVRGFPVKALEIRNSWRRVMVPRVPESEIGKPADRLIGEGPACEILATNQEEIAFGKLSRSSQLRSLEPCVVPAGSLCR